MAADHGSADIGETEGQPTEFRVRLWVQLPQKSFYYYFKIHILLGGDVVASAEAGDDGPGFGDMFGYSEKPRHLGQGAWRMVKSVGTGVVAGAATLVTAPIVGAREGGVKGFASGLGLGLVGAVVLPITVSYHQNFRPVIPQF
jgi:hypothetical protein